VNELVKAELWSIESDGYQVFDWTAEQESRANVETRRAQGAARKAKSTKRYSLHKRGDHSLCKPDMCGHAVTRESRVSNSDPTRPDPTQKEGREGGTPGLALEALDPSAPEKAHQVFNAFVKMAEMVASDAKAIGATVTSTSDKWSREVRAELGEGDYYLSASWNELGPTFWGVYIELADLRNAPQPNREAAVMIVKAVAEEMGHRDLKVFGSEDGYDTDSVEVTLEDCSRFTARHSVCLVSALADLAGIPQDKQKKMLGPAPTRG
jgi:hypothetical protein